MQELHLTSGEVAQVDDDVFEKVKDFKWRLVKPVSYRKYKPYVAGNMILFGKKQKVILHRFITGFRSNKYQVEYRDDNRLNLQRSNLRIIKTGYKGFLKGAFKNEPIRPKETNAMKFERWSLVTQKEQWKGLHGTEFEGFSPDID